jgi:hypothetical protein
MGEQHSQKRGVRSEAQKEADARYSYEPIPPTNPVGGAFGDTRRDTPTDQEAALSIDKKSANESNEPTTD